MESNTVFLANVKVTHMFGKISNIVKYYCNLQQLFYIVLHSKL